MQINVTKMQKAKEGDDAIIMLQNRRDGCSLSVAHLAAVAVTRIQFHGSC